MCASFVDVELIDAYLKPMANPWYSILHLSSCRTIQWHDQQVIRFARGVISGLASFPEAYVRQGLVQSSILGVLDICDTNQERRSVLSASRCLGQLN